MLERLQKIMAAAGVASRRKAEQLILQGRVRVNGQVVSKLGTKADPEHDHIQVDTRRIRLPAEHTYLLLNKPRGYVTTVSDPQHRPTVMDLVRGVKERVYPVGRLDYHTSGLLLLTNDGEFARRLMAASAHIPKTYHVRVAGELDAKDMARLEAGMHLDERPTAPTRVRRLAAGEKPWYEITLTEGRYRQVRRIFEGVGHPVLKLKRVGIGSLSDAKLPAGKFRHLKPQEVVRLKNWPA